MVVSDNKLESYFDYRKDNNGKPVFLEDWIQANRGKILNKRIFYVVRPNLEDDVTKFGIGGMDGGEGAYNRLNQYVITYGKNSRRNKCVGVLLFYLAGNKYNSLVQTSNSLVWKKEKFLKDELKSTTDILPGRGAERTKLPINRLMDLIDRSSNKTTADIETDVRRSARIGQSEVKRTDKIVKVLKRSGTKFLVKWNRPYIDPKTKQSIFDTWEAEKFINESKGGKDALQAFQKK